MAKSEACAEPKDQKSDILAMFFFGSLYIFTPSEKRSFEARL